MEQWEHYMEHSGNTTWNSGNTIWNIVGTLYGTQWEHGRVVLVYTTFLLCLHIIFPPSPRQYRNSENFMFILGTQ